MRKRILSLFIALIMILTLFAGCGKKDGSGKTLSYPVSEEPRCLDPQIAEGDAALTAVYNTMLGLVKIDGNNKIIPGGAEKWEVSGDGKTYTFHIADGLFWHVFDDTSEIVGENFDSRITAYDYAFGIKRALLPETKSPFAKDFYIIKNGEKVNSGEISPENLGIETPDSKTLKITLERPSDEFLYLMATAGAMPCNEKFFNATGGRYGLEVDYYLASGPFYLSKWNHDASLILYKNDDYIAKEEVIPSGVILYVQSGEKTIAEEVKDDKLSAALISSINSGELKPKKQQITSYSGETWGFLINGGYSFAFSSKDLRRAFMLAINIDYAALEENAVPAKGVIPEVCLLGGENYRAKAGNITAPKTNTAMAKALWDKELKALGLKTFEVTVMCTERDEALVRAVIGQWQEVFGISFSAKIDVAPIEDIMDSVNSAGYQIAFAPVSAATSRTDDILKMFLNGYGVYSQSYGDLVKNALSAGKGEKLNAAKKCERFLIDNAFVYPVVSRNEVFALSPECADITYSEYLGSPIFEKGQRYD